MNTHTCTTCASIVYYGIANVVSLPLSRRRCSLLGIAHFAPSLIHKKPYTHLLLMQTRPEANSMLRNQFRKCQIACVKCESAIYLKIYSSLVVKKYFKETIRITREIFPIYFETILVHVIFGEILDFQKS